MILNLPQQYDADEADSNVDPRLLEVSIKSEIRELDTLVAEVKRAEEVVHDTTQLDVWFENHTDLKDVDLVIADGPNGALRSFMDVDVLPSAEEFDVVQCQEGLRDMAANARDAIIKFLKMILDKIKNIWKMAKKLGKAREKSLNQESARLNKLSKASGFNKDVKLTGEFQPKEVVTALNKAVDIGEKLVTKFQDGDYPHIAMAANDAREWAESASDGGLFEPNATRKSPNDIGIGDLDGVLRLVESAKNIHDESNRINNELLRLTEKSTKETLVTYTQVSQKKAYDNSDSGQFSNLGLVLDSKTVPLEEEDLKRLINTIMIFSNALRRMTQFMVENTLAVSGVIK